MSELINTNRSSLLKIFETHQSRGLISFTDVLKICSSLKVFPDLLDSQGIQKMFSGISNGNIQQISYLEFENFLQVVAFKIFGDSSDFIGIFLAHIKNFAAKAYGVEIKTILRSQRCLTKSVKSKKYLNSTTAKNKSLVKLPGSTKNENSKRNLMDLASPSMMKIKNKRVLEATQINMTDRKIKVKKGNVKKWEKIKIAKIGRCLREFEKNMQKIDKKSGLVGRKLKKCLRVADVAHGNLVVMKLFFQIWRISC